MSAATLHTVPAVPALAQAARVAVSVDTLVEAVHFLADTDAVGLGHKSAAVNLSDLAAMGATARHLDLVVERRASDDGWYEALTAGARALCDQHGARLRSVAWQGNVRRISVQAIGTLEGDAAPITRSGARTGDVIAVTGTLGDAGAGLQLLQSGRMDDACAAHRFLRQRLERPTPRLAAGCALRGLAHAGLDISDGLAGDLQHLLHRAAPGIELDLDRLPLSPALGNSVPPGAARRLAASAGDDYELAVALPAGSVALATARLQALGVAFTVVGRVTAETGLRLLLHGQPLPDLTGYQHRFWAST